MNIHSIKTTLATATLTLALAVPGAAMAYGKHDAISDCKKQLRHEYDLHNFHDMEAERLDDDKYKVTGDAKVDGKRYPVKCKIKDRHVVTAKFDGPDSDDQEKEGLSNKQKAALGIAAVVAAAAIASNANKDEKNEKDDFGDLVGMRASSGEQALEERGYKFVNLSKGDDRIWANWWNQDKNKCITVVTMDGRYDSITDTLPADCDRH